ERRKEPEGGILLSLSLAPAFHWALSLSSFFLFLHSFISENTHTHTYTHTHTHTHIYTHTKEAHTCFQSLNSNDPCPSLNVITKENIIIIREHTLPPPQKSQGQR